MLLALHRQATRSHRPSMAMPLAAAPYRASGFVHWGLSRPKPALAMIRFSRLNSAMRYVMEKLPGRDLWAVIDSVTHRPALVNDVPQIDLELDDADDLTDLLNRLEQEASV